MLVELIIPIDRLRLFSQFSCIYQKKAVPLHAKMLPTKIMRKYLLLICLFLLVAPMVCYCDEIRGNVVSDHGEVMPFVTISLLDTDSTLLDGTITDEEGKYVLQVPDKSYILQASYVGYRSAYGGPDFVLGEETEQLQELEVKGKRPLVERQMDKLVLNVSDSPFALGSNTKDLLKKAPGVNIDKDGNVTVNGKGVKVYIDDRPSNLSGEQLKAMLESTDGSTIEKIEIITHPSAKYDAAGQGGIINIKTKRNMMKGLNGSVGGFYSGMYDSQHSHYKQSDFLNANLNYRTEKTYTYLQLGQVYYNGMSSDESYSEYPVVSGTDTTIYKRHSSSVEKSEYQMYRFRLGNDWYIDKKNTIGFIISVPIMIGKTHAPSATSASTFVRMTPLGSDTLEYSRDGSVFDASMIRHQANLNYTHVFNDSLDRELTVNVDYGRNRLTSLQTQDNRLYISPLPDSIHRVQIDARQKINIYSAKMDFQTRFWGTGMLETGMKWALSSTDNRMKTDSTVNTTPLPTESSDFDYREHIAAIYITAGKQFGKHWSAKLGLRGEYTYSTGNWISADSVTHNSYFNLFPTAFVGYNPSDKWGLSLSYTRRIERPDYWYLNPFVRYNSAHSYSEGNPYLKPQFTHAVMFQTNYSQYVSLSFHYDHTTGLFSRGTEIMPNGDQHIFYSNMGRQMAMGIQFGLTEVPIVPKYAVKEDGSREIEGAWLALTLNGSYYYTIRETDDNSYRYTHHKGYVYGELTSYLPKEWTLSADAYWSSPSIYQDIKYSGWYSVSFAVKKRFKEQGLTIGLQANDIVFSPVWESRSINLPAGSSAWSRSYENSRHISVSLQWQFGTQQYTKQRKVGNLDESSRIGSGGDGGKGR